MTRLEFIIFVYRSTPPVLIELHRAVLVVCGLSARKHLDLPGPVHATDRQSRSQIGGLDPFVCVEALQRLVHVISSQDTTVLCQLAWASVSHHLVYVTD